MYAHFSHRTGLPEGGEGEGHAFLSAKGAVTREKKRTGVRSMWAAVIRSAQDEKKEKE